MHLSGALISIIFFMVVLQLVYAQTVFSITQKPILTCDQPGHASCYTLLLSALYTGSEAHAQASSNATTAGGAQSSNFGYYFHKLLTAPPTSYPTNNNTQKPILTCDQPGHASCYSLGYSKGLLNTQTSCSAATLNSFAIANPSQVNNFCSGYRVAAQQALQQQR